MFTRREVLGIMSAAGTLAAAQACTSNSSRSSTTALNPNALDRAAILRRHNPRIRSIDPQAVLSVGNGRFAFNVDCTGLQSLPAAYQVIPLCTMSHWGWHSMPIPPGVNPAALRLKQYPFHGRTIGYPTDPAGQAATYNYMRENPHRLHLGRIGFLLDGKEPDVGQMSSVDQTLDLLTGVIESRFMLAGMPVEVVTCCHPQSDGIAVSFQSALCASSRLTLQILFPYGSGVSNGDGADWNSPTSHTTKSSNSSLGPNTFMLLRELDAFRYVTHGLMSPGQTFRQAGPHQFVITPTRRLNLTTIGFNPDWTPPPVMAGFDETQRESARSWKAYWDRGAAIDLSSCTDPRAPELERRIVLSQYLTAIHCAGNFPSQETGLLCNSWYGKFHLEMHWWHSAHFALWNRWEHFNRPMKVYTKMLASSRARAAAQGFAGARWPKMTGPDGNESPSTINPLIIWQQPHPIYYAELAYRHDPSAHTVDAWREIVEETAEFMASFAQLDAQRDRYVLGPAIRTVAENNSDTDLNPTYELSAWRFGLSTAQRWRERQRLPRNASWDRVLEKLSPAPTADGVYLQHEGQPTYTPQWAYEHPAMLGALGFMPGDGIDRATMAATVRKVRETWDFSRVWGWDFPMAAMAAARTGQPELAMDFLTMEAPTNRYFPNGCNFQRDNLPAYFPGNGGLLAAVALMVEMGFPKQGWDVRSEGFLSLL